jgi:hypothetical protein
MASACNPNATTKSRSLSPALHLAIASFAYRHWTNAPLSHMDVYDGFETQKLSRLWDTDRFERGAVTMQSQIVRAGHTL